MYVHEFGVGSNEHGRFIISLTSLSPSEGINLKISFSPLHGMRNGIKMSIEYCVVCDIDSN